MAKCAHVFSRREDGSQITMAVLISGRAVPDVIIVAEILTTVDATPISDEVLASAIAQ
jgi:hypothetical protein